MEPLCYNSKYECHEVERLSRIKLIGQKIKKRRAERPRYLGRVEINGIKGIFR